MEPDEIERREFVTTFRGYDRNEVDAYLKEMAQEVRRLTKELARLQSAAEKVEIQKHARAPKPVSDKAEAYRRVGEETARVLLAAEAAANEIREAGRHQASEMISEARRQALQIVKEAGEGRRDIEEDLARLKETRTVMAVQLEEVKKRLSDAVARLHAPVESSVVTTPSPHPAEPPARSDAPEAGGPARAPEQPAAAAKREAVAAKPKAKTPRKPEEAKPRSTPEEQAPHRLPGETGDPEAPRADPSRTNGSKPVASGGGTVSTTAPQEVVSAPTPIAVPEAPAADPVEQLLQEIRSESPQSHPRTAAGSEATVTLQTPAEPSDSGNELFDRRARAVEGIPIEAARRLKRLLQEDQNELLHRLRTQRGKGSVADNVPDPAEQISRFNASLQQVLGRAFEEGRKAGGASSPGKPEGPVGNLIARQVVSPLRAEVERVVEAGLVARDTPSAIAERASDVIRVWKGVRTELLGEAMVFAAFHQGLLDAWASKKITKKKWALSLEERHCPSEICRKNAGQGSLALSATFASGHLAPPAHGGCTCTIESARRR